jgi:hypothetical protein
MFAYDFYVVEKAVSSPDSDRNLPHRLSVALFLAQLVAFATLIRSIAYDRWITVLASVLLIGGAFAAQRGKTWGLGLSFAAAVAFPVASMIGIAPPWFWLVGIAGALPFIVASRALARFDKGATTILAAIGIGIGAMGAISWKEYALDVFRQFPALMPSLHAQHTGALVITAIAATIALALRPSLGRPRGADAAEAKLRIGTELRIEESAAANGVEEEEEASDEPREQASLKRRASP